MEHERSPWDAAHEQGDGDAGWPEAYEGPQSSPWDEHFGTEDAPAPTGRRAGAGAPDLPGATGAWQPPADAEPAAAAGDAPGWLHGRILPTNVVGTVVSQVEQTQEPAPRGYALFLAVLVLAPVLISTVLPIVGQVIVALIVLEVLWQFISGREGFIPGMRILGPLGLVRRLLSPMRRAGRGGVRDPVPVTRFQLNRETDGRPHACELRGTLTGAAIRPTDHLRVRGRRGFRHGVLLVHSVVNTNTGARTTGRISPRVRIERAARALLFAAIPLVAVAAALDVLWQAISGVWIVRL